MEDEGPVANDFAVASYRDFADLKTSLLVGEEEFGVVNPFVDVAIAVAAPNQIGNADGVLGRHRADFDLLVCCGYCHRRRIDRNGTARTDPKRSTLK